ncbi:MAG: RNA polymerase sigma factor [Melioribacteraceae bacterium]|nr:RNA polymerase sigma factor [Melioribacteraceae bacterium]
MARSKKDIVEFTLIYNRHKVRIFNYVLRMLGDAMTCEDVVQNVFLKFFENMDAIRNRNSVVYWLFKTARNEIYTIFRRKKIRVDQYNVKDSDELEISDDMDVQIDYENKELKNIILIELESMAYDQREVFILKEYGGLSYREISAVMNIDEELVKSRLYKTRQKLIKRIGPIVLEDNI